MKNFPKSPPRSEIPAWDESWGHQFRPRVVVAHNWDEVRRFMWDYVGIVRSTKRLKRARIGREIAVREINEYYGRFRVTKDLWNCAICAWSRI